MKKTRQVFIKSPLSALHFLPSLPQNKHESERELESVKAILQQCLFHQLVFPYSSFLIFGMAMFFYSFADALVEPMNIVLRLITSLTYKLVHIRWCSSLVKNKNQEDRQHAYWRFRRKILLLAKGFEPTTFQPVGGHNDCPPTGNLGPSL